ncbi:MAG: transglutaminase domain-containing protein [Ferruginibacter sp.]
MNEGIFLIPKLLDSVNALLVNFIYMKYMHALLLTGLLVLAGFGSFSQAPGNDFTVVDDYVKSLGALDTLNMGTISAIITKKFPDPKDKVRAIFDWIAHNISFDLKAGKNNDNEKASTDLVLKFRKANAAGYAALFQDMCSVVKIRCLTVDGYAKYNAEQINEKPDEFNHSWVVVQLGQSPDTWFYVDPTWGSGYTDDKMTKFTKAYNDDYFFADRYIFNYQHFPDNGAWQLGPGPKNVNSFLSLPLVKAAAYEYKLGKFSPNDGLMKAKLNSPVSFSIKLNPGAAIDIVSLEIGEEKKKKTKTVDYTFSGGNIVFSYKFDVEDIYPVNVLVNNKPLLGYMFDVSE